MQNLLIFLLYLILAGCGQGTPHRLAQEQTTVIQLPIDTPGQESANPLSGPYWKLSRLNGEKAAPSPQGMLATHLLFDPNGRDVSGFSGCNVFSGSYSLGVHQQLHMTGLESTRMECPQRQLEIALMQALSNTVQYAISDSFLTLFDRDSSALVLLYARERLME